MSSELNIYVGGATGGLLYKMWAGLNRLKSRTLCWAVQRTAWAV